MTNWLQVSLTWALRLYLWLTVCLLRWACSGTPWMAASITVIHSCIMSWVSMSEERENVWTGGREEGEGCTDDLAQGYVQTLHVRDEGRSYCRMTVNPPKLWQLTIHPVDKAGVYRLVWVARRMVVMTTWLRYTCEMHLQWAVTWFYCTFPRCLTHGSWHSRYESLHRLPKGPQQSSWDEASHDFPRDVYSLQKMSFNQLSCPCHQITFIMTSS